MPRYPRLPDDVEVFRVADEGFVARRGLEVTSLGKNVNPDLLPLLDGTHSYRDVRLRLATSALAAGVLSRFLRQLVRRKLLVEAAQPDPAPTLPPLTRRLAEAIRARRADAFPGGLWEVTTCASGFRALSPPATQPNAPVLALLLTDDPFAPGVAAFAAAADKTGSPWLLVQPEGPMAWCGPLFGREQVAWPTWQNALKQRAPGAHALASHAGADLLAAARRKHRATRERALVAAVLEVAAAPTSSHPLVVFADDSAEAKTFPPHPPMPTDALATLRDDNGEQAFGSGRALPLDAVAGRLRPLVNPVTGPITSVRLQERGNDGIGSFYRAIAFHGHRHRLACWSEEEADRRHPSGGHGPSPPMAEGAALAEAVERLACILPPATLQVRPARADELDAPWVAPNEVDGFAAEQLVADDATTAPHEGPEARPRRWEPTDVIPWVQATRLNSTETVWVPASACFRGIEPPEIRPVCIPSSNGVASGATATEAMLHGFFELIERDAVALWWYGRCPRPPAMIGATPAISTCEPLAAWLKQAGRTLALLDLTHDFGVPVVAAIALSPGTTSIRLGFGCHFDAARAVDKAVTELCYQFPAALAQSPQRARTQGEIGYPTDFDVSSWLLPQAAAPRLPPAADRPTASTPWSEAVSWVSARTRQLGVACLVVDQTPPFSPLPVVRVIVPTLRHFWPRFGPGRLYELTTAWGWRREPLTPTTVNPLAIRL